MQNQNEVIYSSSQKNSKWRTIASIFMPSGLGIFIYIVIFIATVAVSQPSEYKTALNQFSIKNFQGTIFYSSINYFTKIINSQTTNQVAVYVFWVIVAFIIYLIASRLTKNVDELAEDFTLRQYIWPTNNDKNAPLREFAEKIGFHILMFIILIFYLFKAGPALLELWKRTNLTLGFNVHCLKTLAVLFILEFLLLHVTIILIRLFLTRKRIVDL